MRALVNPKTFDPSAHTLDFLPHPDPDIAAPNLVLEGFAHAKISPQDQQSKQAAPAPAPAPAPAKNGAVTKWTPEFTNEMATYRKSHTEAQTAEKYGVSGSLIRRKLAEKKSASKPKATPFSGLVRKVK